jgi:hypothetical protein
VRPAQAEIDQELARRSQDHARRLRGDGRLEVQQVDQPGLDELRLGQRRAHPQDRLVGEEDRSLGHGIDVAGEAEASQIDQHVLTEAPALGQPIQLGLGEAGSLQEPEGLLQSGRHQKAPGIGQLAHEELENRGLGHAGLQVGLHHVELVKIGQQQAGARIDVRR